MRFRPVLLRWLPRYRRLMREGTKTTATVIAERRWGWVVGVVRPNHHLTLRVRFADGSITTIERVERERNLGALYQVGSTLSMRYESGDRTYVEIDCPELRRRSRAREVARNNSRLRDGM